MGDPKELLGAVDALHGMKPLCQAHSSPVVASQWWRGRWRCNECMNAVRDANGRTRLHKEAPSKAFVQSRALPKLVEPSAPPAFREYRPPQSMLDAYAKAHAYHTLPSLVRDD